MAFLIIPHTALPLHPPLAWEAPTPAVRCRPLCREGSPSDCHDHPGVGTANRAMTLFTSLGFSADCRGLT
jgi:hypothetical protein